MSGWRIRVLCCVWSTHFINFYKYLTIFIQYPGNQINVQVYTNEKTPHTPPLSCKHLTCSKISYLELRNMKT